MKKIKKSKKFISGIIALTSCLSVVSSIPASAIFRTYPEIAKDFLENPDRYILVSNADGFITSGEYYKKFSYYLSPYDNEFLSIYKVRDEIYFRLPEDVYNAHESEISEVVANFRSDLDYVSDFKVHVTTTKYANGRPNTKNILIEANNTNIKFTADDARNVYEKVKDYEISEFKLYSDRTWAEIEQEFPYLTGYHYSQKEKLEKFVEENDLDVTIYEFMRENTTLQGSGFEGEIVYYEDYVATDIFGTHFDWDAVYLVPNQKLTRAEHLELAKQIYEGTGCRFYGYAMPDSASSGGVGIEINLSDAVLGDAGDDGNLGIDDVVSVLLSVADSENYALSPQGEFNADVYNTGDGISVADALSIQKYLAGIINDLPES